MEDVVKAPRPTILAGITVRVNTGCGPMYVQLNWYQKRLFEVFATLGKTGGCASCQSEGITRSVTMGLRCGAPVKEYVKQLKGLRCPTPVPFPRESAVWSCPDAISGVLDRYGSLPVADVAKLVVTAIGLEDGELPSEVVTPMTEGEQEKAAMEALEELKSKRVEDGVYED